LGIFANTARSGSEGKKVISEHGEHAVVISNYNMGDGMNGLDFLKFVKSKCPNSVRIIMTGGLHKDALIEITQKEGIDQWMMKPVIVDSFLSQVSEGIKVYKKRIA
jgi:two-component system response regulator HupR/HoxA